MTTNIATTPQPPPTEGTGPRIVDLVCAELANNYRFGLRKAMADNISADIQGRSELGARPPPEGYDRHLRAGDGRDGAADTYQEQLDAIMYWRKEIAENGDDADPGLYCALVDIAARIRRVIDARAAK